MALPYWGKLRPYTLITCLLNRHYVDERTYHTLNNVTTKMITEAGSPVIYLDANFPFFDGYPLFPHLSHSDGKKVDLSFYYTKDGKETYKNASLIGYGYCESPEKSELDYPAKCRREGYWQYDLLTKLLPGSSNEEYKVDTEKTSLLIRLLHQHNETEKLFLEPHLVTRWKLIDLQKIRFHGCHAVRHDDHLHWQVN